jgi:hypothetical protein
MRPFLVSPQLAENIVIPCELSAMRGVQLFGCCRSLALRFNGLG